MQRRASGDFVFRRIQRANFTKPVRGREPRASSRQFFNTYQLQRRIACRHQK